MAFYDRNWVKQDFCYSYPLDKKEIEKPSNLDEMIEIAEKLSKDDCHVRVDFYRLEDGTIYFGEMTYTTCSGCCNWRPARKDIEIGNLINLPTK